MKVGAIFRTLLWTAALTGLSGVPASAAESLTSVALADMGSGVTSPAGYYRWMDVANQLYSQGYQDNYDYTGASVTIDFYDGARTLHGHLAATDLKPNFAYQLKIVGKPEDYPDPNERIGFTGRWWQEVWDSDASAWTGGGNLNSKGDGSFPNPNDETYMDRRDDADPSSPTGLKYRYTAYLVFDYFITDASGDATFDFEATSSYHVLWKTSQEAPGAGDGPTKARTFEVTLPDPAGAYDTAYAETAEEIFGEWERLPAGDVKLDPGTYTADFLLTEESFHGGGLAGGWASAMGAEATFTIVPGPGDIDSNGVVGLGDFSLFTSAYGSAAGGPGWNAPADIDDNGYVGLADFSYFTALYGTSYSYASGGSDDGSVPEPAAVALAAAAGLALLKRRGL